MGRLVAIASVVLCAVGLAHPAGAEVTLFAPASLKLALDAAVAATPPPEGAPPRLVYAGTPALVRQIEAGAPADLFIAADTAWMDHLEAGGHLRAGSRVALLGNRLALIAYRGETSSAVIGPDFPWERRLAGGRLAIGLVDAVPAGRYAKAALTHLGAWDGLAGRLAQTDSVFGVLALVARGEAPLGIVYRTDATADRRVTMIGLFAEASHPPIVYPLAILKGAREPAASRFVARLRSAQARAIFARAGFAVLD